MIPVNVTEAVTVHRVSKKEITPLSPSQVKVFLKAIRGDRLETMFVMAVTTGMRQGELLALKWEDLDLDGRKIIFSPPKTAKGRRSVGLTGPSVECLRKHRALQNREKASWTGDLGLVFPNTDGAPRSSRGYLTEILRSILKENGLPSIRFHDLRHTCATLLLSKNVHPKLVQEMLGHATISITLDTYSHFLPSMMRGAISAMEDLTDDED